MCLESDSDSYTENRRTEESKYWKSEDRNKKNENHSCYQLNSKEDEEEEDQKRMKKKQKSQPGSQHREEQCPS
jgi:hypothetical protein